MEYIWGNLRETSETYLVTQDSISSCTTNKLFEYLQSKTRSNSKQSRCWDLLFWSTLHLTNMPDHTQLRRYDQLPVSMIVSTLLRNIRNSLLETLLGIKLPILFDCMQKSIQSLESLPRNLLFRSTLGIAWTYLTPQTHTEIINL